MIAAFETRDGIYHSAYIWSWWCHGGIIIKREEYGRLAALNSALEADASSLEIAETIVSTTTRAVNEARNVSSR